MDGLEAQDTFDNAPRSYNSSPLLSLLSLLIDHENPRTFGVPDWPHVSLRSREASSWPRLSTKFNSTDPHRPYRLRLSLSASLSVRLPRHDRPFKFIEQAHLRFSSIRHIACRVH